MSATRTIDAAGYVVDWTMPPYCEPGSGIHHLVLEGEDYHKISSEEMSRRTWELQQQVRRNLRKG